MKTNLTAKNRDKVLVFFMVFFVLFLFGTAQAQENPKQQTPNTGKYQALYLGEDKSGFHIILIVNTETAMIEKRIFYDELNDHQDVFNFATKEITTITRKEEKKYESQ